MPAKGMSPRLGVARLSRSLRRPRLKLQDLGGRLLRAPFTTHLGCGRSQVLCLLGSPTRRPSAPSKVSEGPQAATSLGLVLTSAPHGWAAPRKSSGKDALGPPQRSKPNPFVLISLKVPASSVDFSP